MTPSKGCCWFIRRANTIRFK